ncbi:HAD family hydrolase [Streptomyces sp. NPDC001185]|uniref:HAD family hydrolase n=1 Tax=Streptomyces sp. NPDC001185 TaxID=3154380 RepID=UPI003328AD2A
MTEPEPAVSGPAHAAGPVPALHPQAAPHAARTCVLLDRDGTLLDWSGMFLRFIHDLHHQARLPPPLREEILGAAYWRRLRSGELHIGDVRVRDRVDEVVHRYMEHSTLFPGAAASITALARAGARLGLISAWAGTTTTEALLERDGVRAHFTAVLSRDDLAAHESALDDNAAKVRLAARALALMDHKPTDTLYVVGDSHTDVHLGRALAATVIGVRTGNGSTLPPGPPRGPDLWLPSVAGLGVMLGLEHSIAP